MSSLSLPSDPALFLWAAHLGRSAGGDNSAQLNRRIADLGVLVEQYLGGYRRGESLPIMTMLSILELAPFGTARLAFSDGRFKLLSVWGRLGALYGVRGTPPAILAGRAALILALHELLISEDSPPNVEIYIDVLDAELAAIRWEALEMLPLDCALQIQQIDEDWRESAVE